MMRWKSCKCLVICIQYCIDLVSSSGAKGENTHIGTCMIEGIMASFISGDSLVARSIKGGHIDQENPGWIFEFEADPVLTTVAQNDDLDKTRCSGWWYTYPSEKY